LWYRCQWEWLWSSQVVRLRMGRLCQVAMLRQVKLGARQVDTKGLRHHRNLLGMVCMTPRRMYSTLAFLVNAKHKLRGASRVAAILLSLNVHDVIKDLREVQRSDSC